MNFKEFLHIYMIGFVSYMFIEVLWRGHTHWSMGIVGGVCFTVIFIIDVIFNHKTVFFKALFSTIIITAVEFISGIVLNKVFSLSVWDYSNMRFNLMGQISLFYSFLWYLLCIPALFLSKILRHRVFPMYCHSKSNQNKNF